MMVDYLHSRIAAARRVMSSTAGLIGSDYTTEEQAWEMLEGLFSPFAHALTATAITITACYNWYSHNSLASFAAVAVVGPTLLLRLLLNRRFRMRGPDARVSNWIRLFAIMSFIAALGWGSSLSILIFTTQGLPLLAVFALICAPVQGASARAYAMPSVVILHITIVLGLVGIATTVFGIAVAIPFCTLYWLYQISFVMELVALRRKMLKNDYDRRRLLTQVTHYNTNLASLNTQLSAFALTDGLTGVGNRRDFDSKLERCLKCQASGDTALALLLIDVDHFKRFNDTYGHLIGDQCLKLVATAIRSVASRSGDFVARYGGEEFAAVLPVVDAANALMMAERIRRAVEMMDLSGLPKLDERPTVSIGVGVAVSGTKMLPHTLIEIADNALYTAKQSGRNCVRQGVPTRQTLRHLA
ncbi:GGDEF domain-containing protein [Rhodopseudomonas sp. BR0M22]|nr:GGDEF domain-containing protein [Rubrivivax sp. JA1024]NEW94660.1 GGDEF domain-containing protein [Rhodopseudomonas sp. BR0M22]